jgi:NAD-dependent deacetylase
MNRDIPISSEILAKIRAAQAVAVLSGAGISAASGIPTFRGAEGLWKNYRPEELATYDAFIKNPKLVWEWYSWRKNLISQVKPNLAHYALVELENFFREITIITQNVDNLHILAGSKKVIELHGNIMRSKCSICSKPYLERFNPQLQIPHCTDCGALIRPAVVWFGEMLPLSAIEEARKIIADCEILFVVGTSGVVEPAASLPDLAKTGTAAVIEVNPEATVLSQLADEVCRMPADQFFPWLVKSLTVNRKGKY